MSTFDVRGSSTKASLISAKLCRIALIDGNFIANGMPISQARWFVSLQNLGSCSLVALPPMLDFFFYAKDLFVAAIRLWPTTRPKSSSNHLSFILEVGPHSNSARTLARVF